MLRFLHCSTDTNGAPIRKAFNPRLGCSMWSGECCVAAAHRMVLTEGKSASQNEVSSRQCLQACQFDLEVCQFVAIDVAIDDRNVLRRP